MVLFLGGEAILIERGGRPFHEERSVICTE